LIPREGQVDDLGELIGTNSPSTTEPLRLKYQLIEFNVCDEQPKAGVYPPEPASRADRRDERVWVTPEEGVMPASASQSYVGRV